MLSVDRINKLEEENAKLLGQLDAYKMSENEANEIIAELKHKNKVQKEENKKFTLEAKKIVAQYSAKLEWQRKILQKVKDTIENGCYPELDWLFEEKI